MTEYSPRIETLLETGQVTYDDAERMSGNRARAVGGRVIDVVQPRKRRPRYSRRGGRSFPEPSDSELDPHWNSGYVPLDDEQAKINREGLALTKAVGEFVTKPEIRALPADEKDSAIAQFIEEYQAIHNELQDV
jgi:hypothetical protein